MNGVQDSAFKLASAKTGSVIEFLCWTTVIVSEVQPLVEQPEGSVLEITTRIRKRHVSVEMN